MIVRNLIFPIALYNSRRLPGIARSLYSSSLKNSADFSSDENKSEIEEDSQLHLPANEKPLKQLGELHDGNSDQFQMLEDTMERTRGKKRKPAKANYVVLDPKQAGLLKKRRIPDYFKRRRNEEKLSVLEGVELGSLSGHKFDKTLPHRSGSSYSAASNEIFNEIESQRRKLLVFKSSVSKEQAIRSISYQKPTRKVVSRQRYQQLKQLLDSAYTLPQLRAYTKKFYKAPHSKSPKSVVIQQITDKYWKCIINDLINESEDLIMERIIDISTRDMYLLLLTNNGKILNNFARIGATLAVAIDENIVIVRATAPVIKYVEVSLNRILSNVDTASLPVNEIISDHTARHSKPGTSERELVSMVQRESAAYFEETSLESEETDGQYNVSAFGSKRVLKAKNLLLWGVNYHPQLTEKVELCSKDDVGSFKKFPFTDIECFDWINRNKDWFRLQKPLSKNSFPTANSRSLSLAEYDDKLDQWYDFLEQENKVHQKSRVMSLKTEQGTSKVFSLTLGQILTSLKGTEEGETFFEPKITQITSRLLELPLYDHSSSKDELYTVDQHEYYVQLKFIPDLSTVKYEDENAPPLELWFELDDYDNAVTSTARCIVQQNQKALMLQTPHLPHDYRINVDAITELAEPFDEMQEKWLSDQPGIKEFIQNSQLSFSNKKKLIIPRSMNVILPRSDENGEVDKSEVQYDYVNANYHRVLKLMYMNKYMVQFSDVKGGSLGGRYTQVDFIGGEFLDREEFKQFIRDIAKLF